MFFRTLCLTSLLFATACTRTDQPVDTSAIDTAVDTGVDTSSDTAIDTSTDTGDTGDTGPVASIAPEGFAFCAAGGYVESLDYSGVICLGPMDIGAGVSGGNGEPTWQAGPIYILAPE